MDKNLQFKGLWAIVLGGSSGFGLAAVEKLAKHGMNIALLYREPSVSEKPLLKKLLDIAETCLVDILPYNINALDVEGRELFIQKIKLLVDKHSVKLLLHSIARGNLKPLAGKDIKDGTTGTLSIEDIQMTTYAMSNSLLDWTRLLLKEELFNADGRIIGLTSEGAHKYWESYAAVSIAKASLESLSKYMAVEFSPFGLKTNVIQAGVTETPSLKKIPGSEKLIETGIKRNPLGRLTKPQDVANVIYLLCTDEAFWINGSLIHVDGGEHCN
jgi:enoyl-[acyl-carrier protein] reductase III